MRMPSLAGETSVIEGCLYGRPKVAKGVVGDPPRRQQWLWQPIRLGYFHLRRLTAFFASSFSFFHPFAPF